MFFSSFFSHRSIRRPLPIFLLLVSTLACRPQAPGREVVATTDLGDIQRVELDKHLLALPEPRRSPPADLALPEWRRQMLEELIAERALEAEARSKRLIEAPGGIGLLASWRDTFLAQEMGARLVAERVQVTEEDLRAYYDAHPEEFSHPEQIRVRNIYLRVARDAPSDVWEAARLEIEGLLDEIRRGARFGDLARAHSDSETAPLDGLIGRIDRGQLDPALEEILWSLGEGEVSDAIRTPVGFQIFKVENRLGRFQMDFEEARTRLRRRLEREATEAAEKSILLELVEASGATYDPGALTEGDGDDVLFALGNESLTVDGFRQRLESIGFFAARDLPPLQQLEQAVRERLYLWQAERLGLAGEPEIAARLEKMEREVLISLALQERRRAIADRLGEQDLRQLYASREERFQTPKLLHLRILTRDFPEGNSWYGVYEELERLAVEIRSGRQDFARAARELSTDFSAARGGEVGAVRPDVLADWAGPQAQRQILELAVGELSEPILIERYNSNRLTYDRKGYMLVRVEAIEEPRVRTFEEVREKVIEQYLEQSGGELDRRIREDVLRSVDAVIFPENL